MSEWEYSAPISRGQTGKRVRLVQEWLSLHDLSVATDGIFGPATQAGVRAFQRARQLQATGTVNRSTFEALVAPMVTATEPLEPGARGLGQLVVAYAKQHVAQTPREVGGENMGPWVRLYMKGNEGAEWPWCAGFLCYVLRQAARTLAVPMPPPYTFSCDSLAAAAKERGSFLGGRQSVSPSQLGPGSVFLVRRTALDWVHTGIVVSAGAESFQSIEGNTNDTGSREGYEVCARVRGYAAKDFIVI